jgi:hypothetical protein
MPGPGTWSPGDILTADDLNAIGTWQSYSPILDQGGGRSVTVNYAEYCQINKMCIVNVDLTCTTTGTGVKFLVSLPVNTANIYTRQTAFGSGFFFDTSANDVILTTVLRETASTVGFVSDASTSPTSPLSTALGNGDVISFSIVYTTV